MRKDPKLASKRWNLWAPAISAQVFAMGNIDLVSTANNHSFDGGDAGVFETLSHLRDAGVATMGTGATWREATKPYEFRMKGGCVGILPASLKSNLRGGGSAAMAFYPSTRQDELISAVAALAKRCSFVVVYVHWDRQRRLIPSRASRALGRRLVDAGAGLIVGHHPHVLQGFEHYKDGVIAYSLGNFIFSNPDLDKRRSGILRAHFEVDSTTRLARLELLPILIRKRGYLPIPMNSEQSLDLLRRLRSHSRALGPSVLSMVDGRIQILPGRDDAGGR